MSRITNTLRALILKGFKTKTMMDNEDSKNHHIGEGPQTMETETVEKEQGKKTDNKRNKHDINDMTGNDLENDDGRTLLWKADTMTNGESEDQQSREEPETKPFENEQRRETSSKRNKRKNTKKKQKSKSSKPDLNNDLTGNDLENNEGKTLPWKAEAVANGESTDQWGEGVHTMETEQVGNEQGKKTESKRKMRGNLRKKQKSKSSEADLNNDLTANDLENNEGRTLPWEAGTMDKGPQTKTVENQQGKKTGSKRDMRKNQKEKRKSKSSQVPDIDKMLEMPLKTKTCFHAFQVSFMRNKKMQEQKDYWNKHALKELHKCLVRNKGHCSALTKVCNANSALKNHEEAEKIFETRLQQSEHRTSEDKLELYFEYANYLHYNPEASKYESRMDMWHKVMDVAASFEYLNEVSGTWKVSKKAKKPKEVAYKRLLEYYKTQTNPCLEVGILHFQNFKFKEAVEILLRLSGTEVDFKIPWYLAQTYLKLGLEEELQALSQNLRPEEAKETFRNAHENALRAMKVGLNQTESRKLLADIALAIAHNELQLVGIQEMPSTFALSRTQSGHTTPVGQGPQQMPSTSPLLGTQSGHTTPVGQGPQQWPSTSTAIRPEQTRAIPLESACVNSYREAVRCGSVVASLELLRLMSPQLKTTTSRSQFLMILAEIDLCCSSKPSVHLHRDVKPLPLKDDQLDDLSRVDCEKMQNHIVGLMQQIPFFTQAWEEYFNLERRFLEERLTNNDKDLELDGRKEKADDSTKLASKKTRNAGITCCLYIRHLLDHIIGEFREKQLGIQDQEMKQHFPLSRASESDQNDKGRNDLREKLQGYFKIDTETHYPKLFNNLLEAQPSYDSQNDFLQSLLGVVNKCKHQTSEPDKLLKDIDDLVKFSRQCMDRVEKICNFFFDAMKDARDLQTKVEHLEDDIRRGEHEKADELLEVLSSNEDFVVRIGSTWKLLKMMALIRCSRRLSSSRDLEADELWSKLTEGACALTRKLRWCHLAVEDAVKTDPKEVQTKCRDTCREAVELLNSVLAKHKNERKTSAKLNPNSSEGAQQVTETLIAFPFLDMCPDEASRQQNEPGHWKGIVKRQLERNLSKMGIRVDKKLVGIIWKAQPCTDEENYQFLVVEQFLKQCDEGGIIPDTVCMKPDNQEEKTFQMLDLTRWITDNAERIAIKIDTLKVAGQ